MRCGLSIDSVGRFEVMFGFFLWAIVKYQLEAQLSLVLLSDTMAVPVRAAHSMENVPWQIKVPCIKYIETTMKLWNAIKKFDG